MNKILSIVIIVFLLYSCSGNVKKVIPVNESGASNDISVVNPGDSGIVQVSFIDSIANVRIHKEEQQNVILEFKAEGYKKIKGYLSSQDSLANIRFSQILLPDGTMDGPFGRDIDYKISQNGTYRISVHENSMAGDPWAGDFTVDLKLSK